MMYARTEFMCAVVLVASFLVEGSKAIHQVRAAVVSTSTTPSAAASPTALLSFSTLPEPTSCASTRFSWQYTGPENERMTLQVTDVGVSQVAPPSTTTSSTTNSSTTSSSTTSSSARSSSTTSSSIATTRVLVRAAPTIPVSPINLTVTLVTDYDPSTLSYTWNTVNVSQGWYILSATISGAGDPISQTSSPFFIRTGTNISCLGVKSPSLTPTISPSATSSPSVTSIPAISTSTSKVPRIVGITIGMAILISLLILWFIFTRKRKSGIIDGGYIKNTFFRWKGSRDSRGGFDGNAPIQRHRSSRFHLTSQHGSITSSFGHEFEDGKIGVEKKGPDEHGLAMSTIPVLHHQSPRRRPDHTYSASSSSSNVNEFGRSSVRYSNQHSIDSSAVYPPSSRESGSEVLRSHSLSTTGTQHSLSNSIEPSLQPPTSIASKQAHRQSLGKKRKPAPVYHPSEDLSSTSAIFSIPALQPESLLPQLSHKDSFGPGGIEGKPLHYLIPDMPLSQSS